MKARWIMKCECCKAPISTGSQYVMLFGRPWIPKHAQQFRARRQTMKG